MSWETSIKLRLLDLCTTCCSFFSRKFIYDMVSFWNKRKYSRSVKPNYSRIFFTLTLQTCKLDIYIYYLYLSWFLSCRLCNCIACKRFEVQNLWSWTNLEHNTTQVSSLAWSWSTSNFYMLFFSIFFFYITSCLVMPYIVFSALRWVSPNYENKHLLIM